MNVVGKLIIQLLEAIAKQCAAKATPYALQITASLYELGRVTVSVYFDTALQHDQKQTLFTQSVNVLRSLAAEAGDAGEEILSDIPGILLTAVAVDFKTIVSNDH